MHEATCSDTLERVFAVWNLAHNGLLPLLMGTLPYPLVEDYCATYYIIFRFQIIQVDAHLLNTRLILKSL